MRDFFRVATVILLVAAGVYIYELTGGEIAPAKKTVQVASPVKAVPVSKSPPARIKSQRTIDRTRTMPRRPASLERRIEAKGGSDFPVIMPARLVRDEATAKRHNLRLRVSDDGYTSALTLPDYDVVIYGTSRVFRKPDVVLAEQKALQAKPGSTAAIGKDSATYFAPPVRRDYVMGFEEADDGRGGSLSFGRYGVDYHIEFYCHDETESCINAGSAGAFLADMFAEKETEKKDEPRFRINIGIGSSTGRSTRDEQSEPNTQREEPRP